MSGSTYRLLFPPHWILSIVVNQGLSKFKFERPCIDIPSRMNKNRKSAIKIGTMYNY